MPRVLELVGRMKLFVAEQHALAEGSVLSQPLLRDLSDMAATLPNFLKSTFTLLKSIVEQHDVRGFELLLKPSRLTQDFTERAHGMFRFGAGNTPTLVDVGHIAHRHNEGRATVLGKRIADAAARRRLRRKRQTSARVKQLAALPSAWTPDRTDVPLQCSSQPTSDSEQTVAARRVRARTFRRASAIGMVRAPRAQSPLNDKD